jgi:hypothetical protein
VQGAGRQAGELQPARQRDGPHSLPRDAINFGSLRPATITPGPSDACGAYAPPLAIEEIDYSKVPPPNDPLYLPLRELAVPNDGTHAMPAEYDAYANAFTRDSGKNPNPKDAIATNKLPLHLVSPFVKAYQSIAHFLGNVKYGAWNYRGSQVRASVYVAALMRHVDAWCEGQEDDPADGTPHLANALACIGIIIDAKHNASLIDDRQIQNNFAEYLAVREKFEALMVKIRAQYADKNPRHFTRDM